MGKENYASLVTRVRSDWLLSKKHYSVNFSGTLPRELGLNCLFPIHYLGLAGIPRHYPQYLAHNESEGQCNLNKD